MGLLYLCVLSLICVALYQSWDQAVTNAQSLSDNLTQAFEQNLEAMVTRIDLGLVSVVDDVERQNAESSSDLQRLNQEIATQDLRNPEIMGYHVYGPDGQLLTGLHGVANPLGNIQQRDYFKFLQDHADAGLVITPPVQGVTTGQVTVGFNRRINKPDGSFGGVVRAAVSVTRYADMFAWFHPGPHGTAVVYDQSYQELVRYPNEGPPRPLPDDLRHIIDRQADTALLMAATSNHDKSILAVKKVGRYPLYAVVSYADRDYLQQWRQDALNLSLFALIFLVLMTAAARQTAIRVADAKRSEAQMHNSHQRYETLVNNIPWGVFSLRVKDSGDMAFDYVSPRMCQLLDATSDKMLGDVEAVLGKIHHDDVDEVLAGLGEQKPLHWKGRIAVGGAIRNFQIDAVPTLPSSGDVLWNGVIADITEQEEVERQLLATDEKLRGLYELSPLGIVLTSAEGRFVEFNEAFRQITGYSEEQLRSLDYWTLTPAKYKGDEIRQLESLDRTGHYGPYRKEYTNHDGQMVPVQLNGVRIVGADGQNYTWSIVEDVSERLRAEEELSLSLERFRLMTDSVKDYAIYLLDAEGRVLTWNKGAQRLKQFEADEIIGRSIERFYSPEDVEDGKAQSLLEKAKRAGKRRMKAGVCAVTAPASGRTSRCRACAEKMVQSRASSKSLMTSPSASRLRIPGV